MSASLAPECSDRKERYDTCFINWYSEKYLRGNTEPSSECDALFKEYQSCLNKALQEKGIYGIIEKARKGSKDREREEVGL
ncbi:distribution and morphology protein 35 [Trichophaea hybrida]|nr:distribution and morphology protein 35 [Trichophaea hybrida]